MIRCPRVSLLLIAALTSAPAFAVVETFVGFRDRCSGKTIQMAPPVMQDRFLFQVHEVDFTIVIRNAPANTKIKARVEFAPMGFMNNEMQRNEVIEPELRTDASGKAQFDHKVKLNRWRNEQSPTVLTANVVWHTVPLSDFSGGSAATVLVPAKKHTYRVTSNAVCYWEGPVSIVSDYKFNESSNSEVAISRTERLERFIARTYGIGFGFGANQLILDRRASTIGNPGMGGGLMTIFPSDLPAGVWVMDWWRRTYGTRGYSQVEQKWYMHPLDGGYFGLRHTFTRVKAEEYENTYEGGCPVWKLKRTGYMDIGIPDETFYAVPKHLEGRPEEATEVMNALRAPLDTCGDTVPTGGVQYQMRNMTDDLMYFYPY